MSHRDEPTPSEITNEPTVHTRKLYVGASRAANSDATTWSLNAPLMINKQHFGWGGTDGGLDGAKERGRESVAVLGK